ncbi:hypothetical protein [Pseudonocardia asaccharolytica]|uniref:Uncharacterized protein n=1 Tax=Pseudonocardia asaccharolytica DSM 44247 = NBRC 16224 TaxID=1123024 RepID=A0A511D360_9PSEU|nr:hypothetical protein [Pseudonocardia asaccharolytica]GEL19222.1 hypothetical protein PA7_30590 [Pseudonocardia asaccharolytica DSM 44247 = NBRC 16224]
MGSTSSITCRPVNSTSASISTVSTRSSLRNTPGSSVSQPAAERSRSSWAANPSRVLRVALGTPAASRAPARGRTVVSSVAPAAASAPTAEPWATRSSGPSGSGAGRGGTVTGSDRCAPSRSASARSHSCHARRRAVASW